MEQQEKPKRQQKARDTVGDEMLLKMAPDDIKEAIKIITGRARDLVQQAQGYNTYLADRQNRYARDYQLVLGARARKQKEANILLAHVKKLQKRLNELEGRPEAPDLTGGTGAAEQMEILKGDKIVGGKAAFVEPDSGAYREGNE